ncbi:MAG: hypothetical protein U0575_05420 [Phycisphaerales bacterium]
MPRELARSRSQGAWRTVITCLCSVTIGSGFGVIAATGMGMPWLANSALVYGAIAGFVCSPALIFGLWHGPWLVGLLWIAGPTALAAYVGGHVTPPNGGPSLSMGISITAYLVASILRGVIGLKHYRPARPGECASCGYDMIRIAPRVVCPECGTRTG